jgi:phospholipase C
VAPTAPATRAEGLSTVRTVNEIYPGVPSDTKDYPTGPYGLGARVPCLVVSPWSKGGWVCSQTFDHTSIIQFIEQRFGVIEPHITPWRRAVCGDLTSALNLKRADKSISKLPNTADFVEFVSGSELVPLTVAQIAAGKQPVPTLTLSAPADQTMPVQEPGQRPARALPYRLQADARASIDDQSVTINFRNSGEVGAFFHVRTALDASNRGQGTGPWGCTIDHVTRSASDTWRPEGSGNYDLSVFGPNGLFRRFADGLTPLSANLAVWNKHDTTSGGITMIVTNVGATSGIVNVADNYTGHSFEKYLDSGESFPTVLSLQASDRWYDVLITVNVDPSFFRHYAGHGETGEDSVSDPHIGRGEA